MKQRLLTGNGAAAWGARLARADYVPAFPITPQTEIIETLAAWMDQGEMPGKLTVLESEHSMVTAAGAAAATGVRVFTATSSQGLLYAAEMLYTVSGWRVPFVLANVSRGLAAPITLEADHNDILALRDCGCLQIHCATAQEVLDSVLLAYRLAEHPQVRLPAIVNQDGFTLSFTREPVEIPDAAAAAEFVGSYGEVSPLPPGQIRQERIWIYPKGSGQDSPLSEGRDEGIKKPWPAPAFRAGTPQSQAVTVLGGSPYSYFRYQTHLAAQQALAVYDELADEFAARFGRHHPAVECLHMQDADYAFVLLGCYATKARDAVERLRAAGWRIGLVRPRLLRPFPLEALRRALAGVQAAAVIDQNLSPGKGGILHGELCSALYGTANAPLLASFVGGLGGRDISAEEFFAMAEALREAAASGATPPPRLLYTAEELREVRKWQAIAHAGAPTQPPLMGATP